LTEAKDDTGIRDRWAAVDTYLDGLFLSSDPAMDAVRDVIIKEKLPPISVSPSQGKLLYVLAKAMGARRILELGTLGGYSTIWLARALPTTGEVVTIELDPRHAEIARANLKRAQVDHRVDLRVGSCLDVLPALAAEGKAPFDFIFIDADKDNYAEYLDWSVRLSRPGTFIFADNVIREGGVVDPKSTDAAVRGVQRFNKALAADRRVTSTAIQTVGAKSYDGFAAILVTGDGRKSA
jgi:predicted O-methyltransferase YrrM